jgi:hypothetical protein
MSLFDKLKFWKKEEEFNFNEPSKPDLTSSETLGHDFGAHPLAPDSEPLDFSEPSALDTPTENPTSPTSMKSFSSAASRTAAPTAASTSMGGRDLELLNAKLDNIRLVLNSIEQRLANLESGEKKPPQRLW